MPKPMKKITVSKFPIRLGQFLKLANLVQDGFEAKVLIQSGEVLVNGKPENRRGKKLNSCDTVTLGGKTWVVEPEAE